MRFLTAVAICIAFSGSVAAQRAERFNPFLSVSIGASGKRLIRETGKSFQADQATVGFGLPLLFHDFEDNQFGHSRYLKVFLTSQSGLLLPVADSVHQYYMLNAGAALTAIYHSGSKNTYFYSFNSTFYGDAESLQDKVFYRPTAFAAYRHSIDARWAYQLGIAYTYIFGDGLPLPLLGFSYVFRNRSRLNFVAPLNLSYVYSPMSRIFLKFHLSPNGRVQSYLSQSKAPGIGSRFQDLRLKEGRMQAEVFYKTRGSLVLNLGLGILFKRNISFPDLSAEESRYFRQANGLSLQAGVRYIFGTAFKQDMDYEDYFLGTELSN